EQQLSERSRARARERGARDHAHADGIVHLTPAPPPCSLLGCRRYIRPVRKLAVCKPLDSTPRPSTVKRKARVRLNSNPIVPFKPAVTTSSASSTNVPLIAGPLPLRR